MNEAAVTKCFACVSGDPTLGVFIGTTDSSVLENHVDVIKLLLAHGADINAHTTVIPREANTYLRALPMEPEAASLGSGLCPLLMAA